MKHKQSTYDLDDIKELLLKEESRIISLNDQILAARIGYPDEEAIVARVQQLKHSEFHKTMPSKKIQNLMQDVYYTRDYTIDGIIKHKLYIKLQISFNGKGVIVSFKESL